MSSSALAGLIIAGAVVVLVIIVAAAKKSSAPISQRTCGGCNRVMLPQWQKCLFCGWAPVARLEFILGPMANQTLPLTEAVTTIGSVAGNTVVLADPAVSRKHAGIRKVDSDYELADLGVDQRGLRQRSEGPEEDARARRYHPRRQHRGRVQARVDPRNPSRGVHPRLGEGANARR